ARKTNQLTMVLTTGVLAWAIALGTGELALRLANSRYPIYDLEMVRYAKELKMRDLFQEVSHLHRPNTTARLMGVDISLNGLGHRSATDLGTVKGADEARVFVLGNSITMGWGVPLAELFTTRLQDRLNREHVLGPGRRVVIANAGVGNYNTCTEARLAARQLRQVRPDLVLVQYFLPDAEPRGFNSDNLLLKHSYLAAFLYDKLRKLKGLLGNEDLFTHYRRIYEDTSTDWQRTLGCLDEIRASSVSANAFMLAMLVPQPHDLGPGSPYRQLYDKIAATFNARGFALLDTVKAFERRFAGREKGLWVSPEDSHLNMRGHELMAELLHDYLLLHREALAPSH
ncbi:MAG: SGNH/GDSL hydrolase family protein, partial [Deltaproteobacteria bacterium]|nr:SGNH/GDSL hydrolase family protein [Deltaproteobacteria bacterium]